MYKFSYIWHHITRFFSWVGQGFRTKRKSSLQPQQYSWGVGQQQSPSQQPQPQPRPQPQQYSWGIGQQQSPSQQPQPQPRPQPQQYGWGIGQQQSPSQQPQQQQDYRWWAGQQQSPSQQLQPLRCASFPEALYSAVGNNNHINNHRESIAALWAPRRQQDGKYWATRDLPTVTPQQLTNANLQVFYSPYALQGVDLGNMSLGQYFEQAMHTASRKSNRAKNLRWRAVTKARVVAATVSFVDPIHLARTGQTQPLVMDTINCCMPNFMGSNDIDKAIFLQRGIDGQDHLNERLYEDTLKGILYNVLYAAQCRGDSFVVVPPLGMGAYVSHLSQADKVLAQKIFAKALCEVAGRFNNFKGIHLVLKSTDHSTCIQELMNLNNQNKVPAFVSLATDHEMVAYACKLQQTTNGRCALVIPGSDGALNGKACSTHHSPGEEYANQLGYVDPNYSHPALAQISIECVGANNLCNASNIVAIQTPYSIAVTPRAQQNNVSWAQQQHQPNSGWGV